MRLWYCRGKSSSINVSLDLLPSTFIALYPERTQKFMCQKFFSSQVKKIKYSNITFVQCNFFIRSILLQHISWWLNMTTVKEKKRSIENCDRNLLRRIGEYLNFWVNYANKNYFFHNYGLVAFMFPFLLSYSIGICYRVHFTFLFHDTKKFDFFFQ